MRRWVYPLQSFVERLAVYRSERLSEPVSAVQSILAAATVRLVLDGLAGIGMVRRLQDGRYAA